MASELKMLDLQDSRWADLQDAYGSAARIPALLRDLRPLPAARNYRSEPYFSLWSALCHQGDVYTASYAAVPHIVEALCAASGPAVESPLQMVACIEIARANGRGPEVPVDLAEPYRAALDRIPHVVHALTRHPCAEGTLRVASAALAAAHGHARLAEVILELEAEVLDDLIRWIEDR